MFISFIFWWKIYGISTLFRNPLLSAWILSIEFGSFQLLSKLSNYNMTYFKAFVRWLLPVWSIKIVPRHCQHLIFIKIWLKKHSYLRLFDFSKSMNVYFFIKNGIKRYLEVFWRSNTIKRISICSFRGIWFHNSEDDGT